MIRRIFPLALALGPCFAFAQAPDFRARLDLALTFDYQDAHTKSGRLYTPLGRPSIAAITALLDSGYNIYVAERIGRLPKDSAADIFDEAYIEDPGIFRVGKQYLPFGTGRLLHDSVTAFRVDSNLIAENAPISFSVANGGKGRTQGFFLRVGRGVGASVAFGEHLGISATSLGVVRLPDDAPGIGRGWRRAFGFDASRRAGKLTLSGDFVALAGGPDRNFTVVDVEATYVSDGYRTVGLGLSHTEGSESHNFVRLFGRVRAARNLDLEPLIRMRGDRLYDAAVTLRLRL